MRSRSRIEPGLELGGRYRVDEPIGAGGMGDVWRGVDLRLRRPVAIKVLSADLAADDKAVGRFRREAETTAGLQHPGITVTFDIDEHRAGDDHLIFLVMELLTGRDLGTVLDRSPGGVPIEQAVSLVAQAADSLAAAHANGIVHRDIKPANLFLLDDGRVKLCDFGVARLGDATRLTAAGSFIGTPLYMAPEQFRGGRLDARTDLYSLGCVLYELLVGRPPFESGANPAAVMYRHLNETPVPPRSRRPDVPEPIERLTLDLLAKDPARRPPSAAAVAAALGAPLPEPTVDWSPPSDDAATREEPVPRRGRRTSVLIGCAAAVVAAGTAVALTWSSLHRPGPGPTPTRSVTSTPAGRTDPVVSGWRTSLAPQYGIAYDAPPAWKIDAPDYAVWFEDTKGNVLAAEKSVAELDRGRCKLAVAGLRGGSRPVLKPPKEQLGVLQSAAADEARKWANAAYGGSWARPRQPTISTGKVGTTTLNGIDAAQATVEVTPARGGEACTPPHAVVQTIAMAAASGSSVGPIFLTVFAARNVRGQIRQSEIRQLIDSVRPYTCPAGTAPQKNNTCA